MPQSLVLLGNYILDPQPISPGAEITGGTQRRPVNGIRSWR